MLAHEVLRAAAKIVEAGWSDGSAPARDAGGEPVQLLLEVADQLDPAVRAGRAT